MFAILGHSSLTELYTEGLIFVKNHVLLSFIRNHNLQGLNMVGHHTANTTFQQPGTVLKMLS